MGVGEGRYASFEDGDTLDLVTGCQGSQHVWIAVQATGLDPRGVIVDLNLVRERDEVMVSQPYVVRLTLGVLDGVGEQVGLTLIVPEPDEAIGEDLRLITTLTDRDDVSITVERPIRIEWGEGGCR